MDRSTKLFPTVLLSLAALAGGGARAAEDAVDPLQAVQQTVGDWAKLRAETVRIESDWEWQRSLMVSTLGALKDRIGQLELRRDELRAKTATERREVEALGERRQAYATAGRDAEAQLRALDEQLVRLRPALPPRLAAALELSYRSLAAPALPLGERMQHTMTILNRCQHFNGTIVWGEELIAPPGGQPTLMEVAYWGLAQGYALDRTAGRAYCGAPAEGRWQWNAAPELAAAVGRLLAVAQDKCEPEFVQLPVRIDESAQPILKP